MGTKKQKIVFQSDWLTGLKDDFLHMLGQVDWNLLFSRRTGLFWNVLASLEFHFGYVAFSMSDSKLVWSDMLGLTARAQSKVVASHYFCLSVQ